MTKHKSNQDGFTSRGRGSVRRRRFSSILRVRTSRISRSSPSEAKQGGSGNRSVSPRRNPFREEIRKMKNWKDDSEPFHSTRNGSADICESMEDGKSPARRKVSSANNDQKQRDKDNVIKNWQENLEMKITKELLFLRKSKRPVEATVGAVNRVNPAPLRLPPPTICTYQKETEKKSRQRVKVLGNFSLSETYCSYGWWKWCTEFEEGSHTIYINERRVGSKLFSSGVEDGSLLYKATGAGVGKGATSEG